ncbi:phage tail tip lysozyme [Lactobacillus sp. ESL0681]|uniref:phage tail tip lysozyme n=1 Tax=Lactobacillus sp. ESL0681 TaxID=2983211 RepID=UPI0023F92488|nr:phage tail tip lysozyme [Lactobacillus sp. ESL0681]WEV41274.1 phage tail tip lysozyme [Lactobacillus sp. ESL0681]
MQDKPHNSNLVNLVKHKLKHKIILGSIAGSLIALAVFYFVAIFTIILGGGSTSTDCNASDLSSGDSSNGAITGGAWTQKGTKTYKNAKAVFEALTKDIGLSGAAASGVMGNIAHESGFDTTATNPSDGGKGLIQWTFGRESNLKKIAAKKGKDWSDLDVQISQLETDLRNPELWVSAKYHDNSLLKFGQLTDPKEAASRFYISGMEAGGGNAKDPDGTEPARQKNAQQAYKTFNGANVHANKSKLKAASGGKVSTNYNGSDEDEACEVTSSGEWGWPFKQIPKSGPGSNVSGAQLFGNTRSGSNSYHDGVDFGTVPYNNSDILAIHDGKVTKIDHQGNTQNDLGWYVVVKSSDGYSEIYQEFAFAAADKKQIKVSVGDPIKTGDVIGYLSSSTSNVTHVHIGITKKPIEEAISHSFSRAGGWVDPIKTIKSGLK